MAGDSISPMMTSRNRSVMGSFDTLSSIPRSYRACTQRMGSLRGRRAQQGLSRSTQYRLLVQNFVLPRIQACTTGWGARPPNVRDTLAALRCRKATRANTSRAGVSQPFGQRLRLLGPGCEKTQGASTLRVEEICIRGLFSAVSELSGLRGPPEHQWTEPLVLDGRSAHPQPHQAFVSLPSRLPQARDIPCEDFPVEVRQISGGYKQVENRVRHQVPDVLP